jgi:hypothetical protein
VTHLLEVIDENVCVVGKRTYQLTLGGKVKIACFDIEHSYMRTQKDNLALSNSRSTIAQSHDSGRGELSGYLCFLGGSSISLRGQLLGVRTHSLRFMLFDETEGSR